jgi:hypothetical protein
LNIQRIMMAAITGATISGTSRIGLHQPLAAERTIEQQGEGEARAPASRTRSRHEQEGVGQDTSRNAGSVSTAS